MDFNLVTQLSQVRSRTGGTSLVTLYITPTSAL